MRSLRRRERELEHWPLSESVRGAWSAGPPAPRPEELMAAIRPAMLAIDRELEASGRLLQRVAGWRRAWAPRVRLGLGGLAAASVALVLATTLGDRPVVAPASSLRAPLQAALLEPPQSMIYDLEIEDRLPGALLVFDEGDATIIWVGEAADPFDGASLLPADQDQSDAYAGQTTVPWKLL